MKNNNNAPASAQPDRGAAQPHPSQAFLHEPPHYEVRFGSGHVAPYSDIKRQPLKPSAATMPSASQPVAPDGAHAQQEAAPADDVKTVLDALLDKINRAHGDMQQVPPYSAPYSEARERYKAAFHDLRGTIAALAAPTTVPEHSEREAANAGELHNAIMNLRCNVPRAIAMNGASKQAYKEGHRDARHAAAELVATIAAGQEAANAKDAALLRLVVEQRIDLHFEGRCDSEDDAVWADELMKWSDGDRLSATRALIEDAAKQRAAMAAAPSSEKGGAE